MRILLLNGRISISRYERDGFCACFLGYFFLFRRVEIALIRFLFRSGVFKITRYFFFIVYGLIF